MIRETSHFLYKLGIVLKAIIGGVEVILGTAFLLMTHTAIYSAINSALAGELGEAPRDWFWRIIAVGLNDMAAAPEKVWAFVFLSHGIVKLFLIFGLWKERLWAYPTSAFVFTLFVFYQIYQLSSAWSIALLLITILDVLIIALVIYEYKYKKKELEVFTV